MRIIINYIRSMFCWHSFNFEETTKTTYFDGDIDKKGIRVSRTCTKCGWHKSYWKY